MVVKPSVRDTHVQTNIELTCLRVRLRRYIVPGENISKLAYVRVYLRSRWFRHGTMELRRSNLSRIGGENPLRRVRVCVDFWAHPVYARGWVVSIEHGHSVLRPFRCGYICLYLAINMESPSPFVFGDGHCPGRRLGVSVQFR